MICPSCGASPVEGTFCPRCGTALPNNATSVGSYAVPNNAGATPRPARASAPLPSNPQPHAQYNAPANQNMNANAATNVAAGIGNAIAGAAQNIRASGQRFAGAAGGRMGTISGGSFNTSGSAVSSAIVARDTQQHFRYNIERNRRYFDRKPIQLPVLIALICAGTLFSMILVCVISPSSNISTFGPFIMGTIVVLAAMIGWIRRITDRPTDQEIDQMYRNMETEGIAEAMERSSLDESERNLVQPMVFSGPSSENVPARAHSQIGKDGVTRWSNFQMSAVFCTPSQLYYYTAAQSLTAVRRETTTLDIYYKEIAIVRIKRFLGGYGQITIHTTSGDQFAIAYNPDQEGSVYGLRSLLREKKARVIVELAGK